MAKLRPAVVAKHKQVLYNLGRPRADGKLTTMGQAMIDAGYSKSYARAGQITATVAWAEALEDALPDSLLLKVHKEGLNATKPLNEIDGRDEDGKVTYTIKQVEDHPTRHKFLHEAYDVKGRRNTTVTLKTKIGELSLEELEGAIAERVSGALRTLAGETSKGDKQSS